MSVIVPEGEDKQEKAIAALTRAQYTEYDERNILGHTEIPKKMIPAIVMAMTLHETLKTISAQKPNKEDYGFDRDSDEPWMQAEFENDLKAWKKRQVVEHDEVAMCEHVSGKFVFSYGLAMRSVDRKIRAEGVKFGQQRFAAEAEENVGMQSRLLQAVGLGRLTKFNKVYVRKQE